MVFAGDNYTATMTYKPYDLEDVFTLRQQMYN
jgi:hypothetical protein